MALIAFEKIIKEVNDKVSMLESTLNQIVKMASKLTKIKILLILRFDSLNVLSLKESRESNNSCKIVEVREEIVLIINRGFLRKTRFTCVGNSRFEELIEATH
jgi:hypothetical protein